MYSKTILALAVSCLCLVGCVVEKETSTENDTAPVTKDVSLMLEAAPSDPVAVKAMKDGLTGEGDVVVFGRIREFYEGFSGFTLVDQKISP